jgi:hypothetical protein
VAALDVLRATRWPGTLEGVDDEQGIYRDEVVDIIGGLADISSDTLQILAILKGEDEEEHEEDDA